MEQTELKYMFCVKNYCNSFADNNHITAIRDYRYIHIVST